MCAIFGFVGRGDTRPNLHTLGRIVAANANRGPHAFGFAWIDADGRLRCYKRAGRLVDHLAILQLVRDARMVIGHLRWATHGDVESPANNHPHASDGGWIVHNGIVHNYAELVRGRRLWPVGECDSEAIGLLIERGSGTLAGRVSAAVEKCHGPLAVLGLWSRPGTLVAARRGNPIHGTLMPEGLYLGTLATGLPGKVCELPDNTVLQWRVVGGTITRRSVELTPDRYERPLFAGPYRGG